VSSEQVKRALEVHSEQAGMFAERYVQADPYRSSFNYSRKRLDQWLDHYLPATAEPLRLLDVGCGTGHQLLRWRAGGYEVAGVDGSDAMLAEARASIGSPRSRCCVTCRTRRARSRRWRVC
jgi:ubiquinone/menaquinone biosynthesis C-methylase UbiE